MKYTKFFALLASTGLGLLSVSGFAANLWTDVAASRITARGERFPAPETGRTMALKFGAMAGFLIGAPLERDVFAPDSPLEIELPLPEGGFGRFRVVESPIMEPELAKRYPMLKTYLGQGIDNPTATVRFDLTPRGFRAQVIANTHSSYIEPLQQSDIEHYGVFEGANGGVVIGVDRDDACAVNRRAYGAGGGQ